MGTRGYRVVRWRGYYLIIYNHYDSYPSGLGLDILATIPRDPEKYQEWLKDQRKYMDQRIEEGEDDDDYDDERLGRIEPQNDLFIEWMYEIDLDHEVFLVDGEPLFSLSNLPSADKFEDYIGVDQYGHRSYTADTPEEYRYKWNAPPPAIDPAIITKYQTLVTEDPVFNLHSLLGVQEPTAIDTLRSTFYQSLIGVFMFKYCVHHYIIRFDTLRDEGEIPLDLAHLGLTMLSLGLLPMVFEGRGYPYMRPLFEGRRRGLHFLHPVSSEVRVDHYTPASLENASDGVVWVIKGVCCMKMTTHLDDEASVKAAIVTVIDHIQRIKSGQQEQISTVVYGVLFSFFHCVIVRVETTEKGTILCTRSTSLQFLPSWHSQDLSTPGINAVAYLGRLLSPIALSNDMKVVNDPFSDQETQSTMSIAQTIPHEIWNMVAYHLHSHRDLLALASISSAARAAAIDAFSLPRVDNTTLLRLATSKRGREPETCDDEEDSDYKEIIGVFDVIRDERLNGHRGVRIKNAVHEIEESLTIRVVYASTRNCYPRILLYRPSWYDSESFRSSGFREHMAVGLGEVWANYSLA